MEAYVSFDPKDLPHDAPALDRAALESALKSHNVLKGILEEGIAEGLQKLQNKESFAGLLVARGAQAENGADGRFVPSEKTARSGPVLDETGQIDYRERSAYQAVAKGDVLGVKHASTPGREGFTVTGKRLAATAGKERGPSAGPNVGAERAADGSTTFRATVDGAFRIKNEKLEVSPVTQIKGDVDFSIGNVRTRGDLEIRGGIMTGFKVEATGDVDVREAVEGAEIAAGGDVTCRSGVRGQGTGKITCGGTFKAQFVERATLEVRGDVEIDGALIDSRVTAGGKVTVVKQKGVIMGGEIRAARGIEAKQIGSDAEAATTIAVGTDVLAEQEIGRLADELKATEDMLAKMERKVPAAILEHDAPPGLPPERQAAARKIREKWKELKSHKEDLLRQQEALTAAAPAQAQGKAVIRVSGKLCPRVTVQFPRFKMITKSEYRNVTLLESEEKSEIVISQH